jgi:sulfatase maturation enzyme AslB (radical SAM superfamily)
MINYNEIRGVHIELSSNCNARCPQCPRNFHGLEYNAGYDVRSMTLAEFQTILKPEFIAQLDNVLFNGNLGDFMMAQDAVEIVQYLLANNKRLFIDIVTNGSARDTDFWKSLASCQVRIEFALDGLEDTHSIHRQDTQFNRVLKNAQAYINAGGFAIWKFIKFEHNEHQIEEARELSKTMGFQGIKIVDHGRNLGPIFDRHGNYLRHLSKPYGETDPNNKNTVEAMLSMQKESYQKKYYMKGKIYDIKPIVCDAKKNNKIYIQSNGDVFPCCFMGYYPETFDPAIVNGIDQIKELINGVNHNALNYSIEECIQWFNKIEERWNLEKYEDGRLLICNSQCGLENTAAKHFWDNNLTIPSYGPQTN